MTNVYFVLFIPLMNTIPLTTKIFVLAEASYDQSYKKASVCHNVHMQIKFSGVSIVKGSVSVVGVKKYRPFKLKKKYSTKD